MGFSESGKCPVLFLVGAGGGVGSRVVNDLLRSSIHYMLVCFVPCERIGGVDPGRL